MLRDFEGHALELSEMGQPKFSIHVANNVDGKNEPPPQVSISDWLLLNVPPSLTSLLLICSLLLVQLMNTSMNRENSCKIWCHFGTVIGNTSPRSVSTFAQFVSVNIGACRRC